MRARRAPCEGRAQNSGPQFSLSLLFGGGGGGTPKLGTSPARHKARSLKLQLSTIKGQ